MDYFPKTRQRIEELEKTNEDFRIVKKHLTKHGKTYLILGVGMYVGYKLHKPSLTTIIHEASANGGEMSESSILDFMARTGKDVVISKAAGNIIEEVGVATLQLDSGPFVDIIDWAHPQVADNVDLSAIPVKAILNTLTHP